MALPVGTKLGRYEIRSQLGEGGMGQVYLAQDSKLDRKVALKILPAEVASNQDRMRRFVQEAKAASALNHPNIFTIHEIDETDSGHFIATEFIDGVTLRERMRNGPMSLDEVLDVATQVSTALSAAHAAGIVHRDIKPDNIMLRNDGIVKVVDFGIAKLTERNSFGDIDSEAPTQASVRTEAGAVMGTAIYMSPEQARAVEVDARADIFSFGVVTYEMVAGRLPFDGLSTNEILASILASKEVPPLARYVHDVPEELERIVSKALRKDRNERYQTIKDLLIDLKRLRDRLAFEAEFERSAAPFAAANTTLSKQHQLEAKTTVQAAMPTQSSVEYVVHNIKGHKLYVGAIAVLSVAFIGGYWLWSSRVAGTDQINSIAVLPFENRSGSPDSEYLSDGLAESLIYRLSQLPHLRVSPSSSVFRYKGKEIDSRRIAADLGVEAVMSGRLVQRGDNLTISVELIDARDNTLLWGEQYDRKISDLLTTQREIATTIAQKLQLKLSGAETTGITKKYTNNNEAYQLYLKARFHFAKRTKDDIARSVQYYKEAIALDPNFALAYARISESYLNMPTYAYLSPNEAFPQAKAAAERALEIDPALAEAYTFLAYSLAVYNWNWAEAERRFQRAIELDANSSAAHFRYGAQCLAPLGRFDEAINEVRRALEIEPLDLTMAATLGWVYLGARQNDKALEQARKAYDLEPNFIVSRWSLSQALIVKGMYQEAITLNEESLKLDGSNQLAIRDAGVAYARAGRRVEAEEMIKRFKELAKSRYVLSYRIANIYAALGDKDAAFVELEKAVENRDWDLHRLKGDQFMDPLRDDPRYASILKRLNLPE